MLSTCQHRKIEKVLQTCFVFDIVSLENSAGIAEMLHVQSCRCATSTTITLQLPLHCTTTTATPTSILRYITLRYPNYTRTTASTATSAFSTRLHYMTLRQLDYFTKQLQPQVQPQLYLE